MKTCALALVMLLSQQAPVLARGYDPNILIRSALQESDTLLDLLITPPPGRRDVPAPAANPHAMKSACARIAHISHMLLLASQGIRAELFGASSNGFGGRREINEMKDEIETAGKGLCGFANDLRVPPGVPSTPVVSRVVNVRERLRRLSFQRFEVERDSGVTGETWTKFSLSNLNQVKIQLADTNGVPLTRFADRIPPLAICYFLGSANVATQLAARAQDPAGGTRDTNASACFEATRRAATVLFETRNSFCLGEEMGRGIAPGAISAGLSRSVDQATSQLRSIEQSCDLN